MAVDKSKVILRLKALFPKVNLSQKRMDSIADRLCNTPEDDAEDSAIDEVINEFNEFMPLERIAKDDDRERKAKAKTKTKPKPKATEDDDDDEEEILPDDTPDYIKVLMEQNKEIAKSNKELKKELDGIKNGTITNAKREEARKTFENSDVLKGMKPEIQEKWLDRFDLESETSLEDQAKEFETEYSELVQTNADNRHYSGPPGTGKPDGEIKQVEVDGVLDKMNI